MVGCAGDDRLRQNMPTRTVVQESVSSFARSAHMRSMTYAPDPRADVTCTNDYCALLPRRRDAHEARARSSDCPPAA